MNTRRLLTLTTLSMTALAGLAPTQAVAAAGHGKPACSLRTLRGDYGGNFTGTSSDGPFALQALNSFNGDGTASIKGTLTSETSAPTRFTATAAYTLHSDCTGSLTSVRSTGETVHYAIVVTSEGATVSLLRTDPGYVSTGTLKRVC